MSEFDSVCFGLVWFGQKKREKGKGKLKRRVGQAFFPSLPFPFLFFFFFFFDERAVLAFFLLSLLLLLL